MSYHTIDELNGEPVLFGVACEDGGDARMNRFCASVVGNTSREFMNAFAYDVTDCIRRHGRVEQLVTSNDSSGLRYHPRRLERMDGRVGSTSMRLRRVDRGYSLTFEG
jgi:hypothetical protein